MNPDPKRAVSHCFSHQQVHDRFDFKSALLTALGRLFSRFCKKMNETTYQQTRFLGVRYVLGQIAATEAAEWACDLLAQGVDSAHLRFVAGYTRQEIEQSLDEFRRDLNAAFQELGIDLPAKPAAFSEFACFFCAQYPNGALSYRDALSGLYEIWSETNYLTGRNVDQIGDFAKIANRVTVLVRDGLDGNKTLMSPEVFSRLRRLGNVVKDRGIPSIDSAAGRTFLRVFGKIGKTGLRILNAIPDFINPNYFPPPRKVPAEPKEA